MEEEGVKDEPRCPAWVARQQLKEERPNRKEAMSFLSLRF